MHYVLYIPAGVGYDGREMLAAAGVPALFDKSLGCLVSDVDGERGPDGGGGKLLRWDDPRHGERNATANIDDKTWWPDQPAGRFWIGWHESQPPGPLDLQRNATLADDPTLSSFPVVLEDGRRWWVPVARDLPKCYVQDPDTGQQTLAPKTRYQQFWDDTLAVRELYAAGEIDRDYQMEGVFEYAVDALALNYRLCREVVLALRLFDRADPIHILAAAVEQSTRFERNITLIERTGNLLVEKKKPATNPSTNPAIANS